MILVTLNETDPRNILTKFYENPPIDVRDIDADGRADGQTDIRPKNNMSPPKNFGGRHNFWICRDGDVMSNSGLCAE